MSKGASIWATYILAVGTATACASSFAQLTAVAASFGRGSLAQNAGSGTTDQNAGSGTKAAKEKSERKLKGCIHSEDGQTVLEEKSGKTINLTGADVSAQNGHEVAVFGAWESGASVTASSSSGATAKAGKTFNVTSVDMISESCSGGKSKSGAKSATRPQSKEQ